MCRDPRRLHYRTFRSEGLPRSPAPNVEGSVRARRKLGLILFARMLNTDEFESAFRARTKSLLCSRHHR